MSTEQEDDVMQYQHRWGQREFFARGCPRSGGVPTKWVVVMAALALGALALPGKTDPATAAAAPATEGYNVRDYGAVGYGKVDDVQGLLKALTDMHAAGG